MMHERIGNKRLLAAGCLLVVAVVAGWIAESAAQQTFGMKNSARALALGKDGTLFVGTFGNGIYRSRDKGAHWEKASNGLDDPYILVLHPMSKDVVFAGSARKGVYRTRDGGDHWKLINTGIGPTEVKALLFHKNTLFAGTGDGVFKSVNQGDHWEPFNVGMHRILVRTLAVDDRGFMFAGTEGKGLYVIEPDAKEWKQSTRGFRAEPGPGILDTFIRTLTVGPDGTLYSGTFDGGVYVSRNGGERWDWWSKGMDNQSIRSVLVGSDGTLYAGTGKGVYARGSNGAAWELITKELEDDTVQSMVIDSDGTLYVGTNNGLYKGDIHGKWIEITPMYSQTRLPPAREGRPLPDAGRLQ
jgi:ligand-binding sensor domain-containing protein